MEDIERRREARRRRILENSQNRFNRITGTAEKSDNTCTYNSYREGPTEYPFNMAPEANENISVQMQTQENRTKPLVKVTQKQYKKTVVSALAIFVNILLVILDKFKFDYSSSNINKIFIPLLLYELIDFLSSPKQQTENHFIFLFLAASAKNQYMSTVIKYLQFVAYIMEDVMIYFFVYVCCIYVKYLL